MPGSPRGPPGARRSGPLTWCWPTCTALGQHEGVWASETELAVPAADRAMPAAQDADEPLALAGAAWTLGMVQRSAGDTEGALDLAGNAAALLEPRLEDGPDELRAMYGALQL